MVQFLLAFTNYQRLSWHGHVWKEKSICRSIDQSFDRSQLSKNKLIKRDSIEICHWYTWKLRRGNKWNVAVDVDLLWHDEQLRRAGKKKKKKRQNAIRCFSLLSTQRYTPPNVLIMFTSPFLLLLFFPYMSLYLINSLSLSSFLLLLLIANYLSI